MIKVVKTFLFFLPILYAGCMNADQDQVRAGSASTEQASPAETLLLRNDRPVEVPEKVCRLNAAKLLKDVST